MSVIQSGRGRADTAGQKRQKLGVIPFFRGKVEVEVEVDSRRSRRGWPSPYEAYGTVEVRYPALSAACPWFACCPTQVDEASLRRR